MFNLLDLDICVDQNRLSRQGGLIARPFAFEQPKYQFERSWIPENFGGLYIVHATSLLETQILLVKHMYILKPHNMRNDVPLEVKLQGW